MYLLIRATNKVEGVRRMFVQDETNWEPPDSLNEKFLNSRLKIYRKSTKKYNFDNDFKCTFSSNYIRHRKNSPNFSCLYHIQRQQEVVFFNIMGVQQGGIPFDKTFQQEGGERRVWCRIKILIY